MKSINLKSIIIVLAIAYSYLNVWAQKSEYYRHLVFRESPYSDIKGIHPINKKEANKEAHYRFDYDSKNQLIEVSHRIGDDLITDNNNWDSFMWFSPKLVITYSKGKETRYFYNHFNEQIEAHGKMFKAEFDINSEGKRTAVRFYDKQNKPSENAWGIHTYKWYKHSAESVMEERFDIKGNPKTVRPNFTFYRIELVYGDDDYLDFMYHLDEEGNLINNTMKAAMDRIVYDNEGNFSRWMVFDKNKKPVEGNAPGLAIGEHLYDARGNKVGMRGFDVEGRLKAFPSGIASETHVYDEFNNPTESKYFDLGNNLLQHVKRIYSKDGKRLEWMKFLDQNGELKMHPRAKLAAMKLEYDKEGRVIERKRFDEKLGVIKN